MIRQSFDFDLDLFSLCFFSPGNPDLKNTILHLRLYYVSLNFRREAADPAERTIGRFPAIVVFFEESEKSMGTRIFTVANIVTSL